MGPQDQGRLTESACAPPPFTAFTTIARFAETSIKPTGLIISLQDAEIYKAVHEFIRSPIAGAHGRGDKTQNYRAT
ncbi:MAG: hypothetical protein JKY20_11940 [Alphaproteobacteria bacterium]|nr:hypothetical protein [Alphaproteobacteria bacterium]